MRATIVAPKLLTARPKLKLPVPRAPFRVHLERLHRGEIVPPSPAGHTPSPHYPSRAATESPRPAAPPAKRATLERDELRELDSAARTATLLAPPPQLAPPPPPPQLAPPPATIAAQQVAIELVEKAAFWGDGTRGVARLRFNGRARAGLANATITLEHDGDETHLRVDGVDPETEQELRERLAARGVTLSGES